MFNVIRHPPDAWTAQQMREISPWDAGPKYLICDNDGKFGGYSKPPLGHAQKSSTHRFILSRQMDIAIECSAA